MKNSKSKKADRRSDLHVVSRSDAAALQAYFAEQGSSLLPMLELIEDARASVDELMSEAARTFVEQLLVLSAEEVAGGQSARAGALVRHAVGADRALGAEVDRQAPPAAHQRRGEPGGGRAGI